MRRWGAAWLLLLVWLLLIGRAEGQQAGRFLTEYRLDRALIEVPFEYRQRQILVHAEANDKKDLFFLFDTGATVPVLDKGLGLTGYHIADTVMREAEGSTRAEAVWLDSLRLNGTDGLARVDNISVLLADLSQVSRLLGRKIDGILGIGFMAGFVTEIDYAKKVLRFHDRRTYTIARRKPDNQRTFLFDLKPSDPKQPAPCVLVSGRLDSQYDYDFLLDTGFGGYLSVAHSAASQSGLFKADTPRVATTSFSMSRRFQSNKIRASFLMLGEINLSGRVIQVDIRNGDMDGQVGIVGNRLLQNYNLILDYPRMKLWLERITDREEPDENEKPSFGLTTRVNGKTLRVERVTRNSPAYRNGIRPGDVIVAVNGQSLEMMSGTQATGLITAAKGEVKLELARGVDPNFGTRGGPVTLTLVPSSPLDWKAD